MAATRRPGESLREFWTRRKNAWWGRYKRSGRSDNEALRMHLVYKAKLGLWDNRYCAYYGVDASKVTKEVKRFFTRGYAAGLVPTSGYRGRGGSSYHDVFPSRAGDLGLRGPEVGTTKGRLKMERFQAAEYKRADRIKHTELIGPRNDLTILRGNKTSLAEGTALENMHDNHVHGGF